MDIMGSMKKSSNPNRTRYQKYRLLFYLCLLFIALTIVVCVEYRTWISMIWTIVFALFAWQCHVQAKISRCGLAGEEKTYDMLLNLPKAYTVLNNIELEVNGKKGELDLLVISEFGLFIVEVKNHSGTIIGRKGQNTWRQEKISGTKYMKNPIHQLEREMRLLREMLDPFQIRIPIFGCVYFSNAKKVETDSSNVIMDPDRLMDRICAFKNPILKKSDIRKIIRILR